MQLYAFDSQDALVAASHAAKKCDYFCLECRGIVRVRSGFHRQPHFFHLQPTETCHLSAKSMAHIQVQCHLYNALPPDECRLEMRFPEISRVADVVWIPQKLIFEVQCSPITAEEVHARMIDYNSQGYQVIWILHDDRFNKHRLSAAELYLKSHPHYFTNIDDEGGGCIYDQFDLFIRGMRKGKLAPLIVDMTQPFTIPESKPKEGPRILFERMVQWPVHFAGDLIDQAYLDPEYLSQALQIEWQLCPQPPPKTLMSYLQEALQSWFIRPYRLLFHLLLERVSK